MRWPQREWKEQGWTIRDAVLNGRPAALILQSGQLDSVISVTPGADGRIAWIYLMRNPDKLAGITRLLDA